MSWSRYIVCYFILPATCHIFLCNYLMELFKYLESHVVSTSQGCCRGVVGGDLCMSTAMDSCATRPSHTYAWGLAPPIFKHIACLSRKLSSTKSPLKLYHSRIAYVTAVVWLHLNFVWRYSKVASKEGHLAMTYIYFK